MEVLPTRITLRKRTRYSRFVFLDVGKDDANEAHMRKWLRQKQSLTWSSLKRHSAQCTTVSMAPITLKSDELRVECADHPSRLNIAHLVHNLSHPNLNCETLAQLADTNQYRVTMLLNANVFSFRKFNQMTNVQGRYLCSGIQARVTNSVDVMVDRHMPEHHRGCPQLATK